MSDDIDATVKRMLAHLDQLLIDGKMFQEDYDKTARDIRAWAESKTEKGNDTQQSHG